MSTLLHRFWFTFKNPPQLSALNLGCGVTAYSRDDALGLLQGRSSIPMDSLQIDEVVENVQIDSLDPGHVLPNMGDVSQRGVWFPLGL
jgi:hypothetical protein